MVPLDELSMETAVMLKSQATYLTLRHYVIEYSRLLSYPVTRDTTRYLPKVIYLA